MSSIKIILLAFQGSYVMLCWSKCNFILKNQQQYGFHGISCMLHILCPL